MRHLSHLVFIGSYIPYLPISRLPYTRACAFNPVVMLRSVVVAPASLMMALSFLLVASDQKIP
jgi:hypothetical protein